MTTQNILWCSFGRRQGNGYADLDIRSIRAWKLKMLLKTSNLICKSQLDRGSINYLQIARLLSSSRLFVCTFIGEGDVNRPCASKRIDNGNTNPDSLSCYIKLLGYITWLSDSNTEWCKSVVTSLFRTSKRCQYLEQTSDVFFNLKL